MAVLKSIQNNLIFANSAVKMLKQLSDHTETSKTLAIDELEASFEKHEDRTALVFDDTIFSYGEFDAECNRMANWALSEGMVAGDHVALFMENCPQYLFTWMGLAKIGVVTALINHNLTGEGLAHCVSLADAKYLIAGHQQAQALRETKPLFSPDLKMWSLAGVEATPLRPLLNDAVISRPSRKHRAGLSATDLCLYVYTSGTTGLPKGARLTNLRMRNMMKYFIIPTGVNSSDRVYNCLPLYHGTGGIAAVGQVFLSGAAMLLREKFSTSKFWDDVRAGDATMIVYIGELCRYLLNAPVSDKDKKHHVRGGFGNGLRPDVWEKFLNRFGVPKLVEFYGSTEGNISFVNFDGHVGAVGRLPHWLPKSLRGVVAFVKYDVVEDRPERDKRGFCVPVKHGEPGEALGKIDGTARQRFEGYHDKEATEKKLLRNVFKKGDVWFRSGDLMAQDSKGYIYFIDRVGDTFRWKGENVSTHQVAEAVTAFAAINTANIYGVHVPGTDGRAGMAAITHSEDIDFEALGTHLKMALPPYAMPLFLRQQHEVEETGTFKFRKVELVRDGFNPENTTDPLWFFDVQVGAYIPLTRDVYDTILSGGYRL